MIDPKHVRKVQTVMNVEQAMTAELNRMVRGFRLIRSDAQRPSPTASRTAASPPYSSMVRKINVSETVMPPETRGILITTLELTAITSRARIKNGRSSRTSGKRYSEKRRIAAPTATTPHMYGATKRCLPIASALRQPNCIRSVVFPVQVDGVIRISQFIAHAVVEGLGHHIALVDEQANRVRARSEERR